jgi:hypothetical protein
MKAAQILEHLNSWFTMEFCPEAPMPDNAHEDYAEMRMTVFRAPQLWAIVLEDVGYWSNAAAFHLNTYIYGNCLYQEGGFFGAEIDLEFAADKPPGEWRGKKYFRLLDRANFSVVIDGQRHDFQPTAQDYEDAGIRFVHDRTGAASLSITQMLRFLCFKLNHPFFAPREELDRVLDECANPQKVPLSQQMEIFLQTRDWQHPRIGEDEESPISSLEGWQVLARAIESGNLSEWNQLDPSLFNTHWSFWDQGQDEDRFLSDPDEDQAWQERQRQQQMHAGWERVLKGVPPDLRRIFEAEIQQRSLSSSAASMSQLVVPYENSQWVFTMSGREQHLEVRVVKEGEAGWRTAPRPQEETQ